MPFITVEDVLVKGESSPALVSVHRSNDRTVHVFLDNATNVDGQTLAWITLTPEQARLLSDWLA